MFIQKLNKPTFISAASRALQQSACFSTDANKKNWRDLPEFSVEDFLENKTGWEMDPVILRKYLDKSLKQSLINFRNKDEEN